MLDCVLVYSADLSHPHIMTFERSTIYLGSILYGNLLKQTSGEGVSRDPSIVGETLESYLFMGWKYTVWQSVENNLWGGCLKGSEYCW
jgi:hypothetical protein